MAWLRFPTPIAGTLQELKQWLDASFDSLDGDLQRIEGITGFDTVLILTCTGTPEGQITAPVGSLATRLDGGASTTLYVQESGTGNTGWVAKYAS